MSTNTITGVVKVSDLATVTDREASDTVLLLRDGKIYRIAVDDLSPIQINNLPTLYETTNNDRLLILHEGAFGQIMPGNLTLAMRQISDLNPALGDLWGAIGTLQYGAAYKADWSMGIAASALSGHRAMTVNAAGLVTYAQPGNHVVGISTSAYTAEVTVVMYDRGLITESTWTWTVGAPIYLAADGVLTQTLPTSGIVQILGFAQTATTMLVNIQPAITLAS